MTPRGVLAFAASTLLLAATTPGATGEEARPWVLLLDPEGGGDVGDAEALCASLPPPGANASHDPGGTRPWTRACARRARGLCRRVIGGGDGRARGVVSGVSGVFTRANVRALRRCLGARVLLAEPDRDVFALRDLTERASSPSPSPRPNPFPGSSTASTSASSPSTASPPPRAAPARTSTSSTRASARPTASSPAPAS